MQQQFEPLHHSDVRLNLGCASERHELRSVSKPATLVFVEPESPETKPSPWKNFMEEYLENAPQHELDELEELAELDRQGVPLDCELPSRRTG